MALRAGHIVTAADFDLIGLYKVKSANESVTSSTVLQNDDQLFVSVAANASYILDCWFQYTAAAAGGLKLDWSVPSGAACSTTNFGVNFGGVLTDYNVVVTAAGSTRSVGGNGAVVMSCQPRGYVTVGSTSGNVQLRWAQDTSNGTATTILTGSYLRLVRVA